VVVGADTAHEGEKPPEERAGQDVREFRLGNWKKVNPPGDEKAPQNDATVSKKEKKGSFFWTH